MPYPRTHERLHEDGGVYPIEADTLLLLEVALDEARANDRVLEIGTGTGYIASELLKVASNVLATELNPHATRLAKARGVEVIRTDLAKGIEQRFDLILFNPPYLPTSEHERMQDWMELALDGGPTGRATIERFAFIAEEQLAPKGRILLLISSLTGEGEVRRLFEERGFSVEVVKRMEYEGEELMVMRIACGRG